MNIIYKFALKRNAPYFPCPKSGIDIPLEQESVLTWNSFYNFTQIIVNTSMSVVQKFKYNIASCIMKDIKLVDKITDRTPIGVKTKRRSKKRLRVEMINDL